MPEQLLNGAQISSGTQQMGGEGMAQRVGRRFFRQAELNPQSLHAFLHNARIEAPAAHTNE